MQIVDWIPIVFYGIGISTLIIPVLRKPGHENDFDWWYSVQDLQPQQAIQATVLTPKFIVSFFVLLIIGLSYPLADRVIPARYSQERLENNIMQLALNNEKDKIAESESGIQDEDLLILQGRMITPRYFVAGDRMIDHRWNTTPDYSYSRIEFYLVGTENTWVALPSEAGLESLPHGKDVIVIGTREEGATDDNGAPVYGEYIQARKIYILPEDPETGSIILIPCSGSACAN